MWAVIENRMNCILSCYKGSTVWMYKRTQDSKFETMMNQPVDCSHILLQMIWIHPKIWPWGHRLTQYVHMCININRHFSLSLVYSCLFGTVLLLHIYLLLSQNLIVIGGWFVSITFLKIMKITSCSQVDSIVSVLTFSSSVSTEVIY